MSTLQLTDCAVRTLAISSHSGRWS